jgi:hypothetical protein
MDTGEIFLAIYVLPVLYFSYRFQVTTDYTLLQKGSMWPFALAHHLIRKRPFLDFWK